MRIDGKEDVKERIKIFEGDYFITYLYVFENGNSYKESVRHWRRQDMKKYVNTDAGQKIDRRLGKYAQIGR